MNFLYQIKWNITGRLHRLQILGLSGQWISDPNSNQTSWMEDSII